MEPHKIDSDYFWLILDIRKTALLPSQVARPGLEFSHCFAIQDSCGITLGLGIGIIKEM